MGVLVLAGTKKGLFLLRSDDGRRDWELEGPLLDGWRFVRTTPVVRGLIQGMFGAQGEIYSTTVHRLAELVAKPLYPEKEERGRLSRWVDPDIRR